MNRIRFAMAPENPSAEKLMGTVEVDETYVGGKPRYRNQYPLGRGTRKTPVFAAVERQGRIRRRVIADVNGKTLKGAIREMVDAQSRIISDDFSSYMGIGKEFSGGHHTVAHGTREYVRGDIHTNHGRKLVCDIEARHYGHLPQCEQAVLAPLSLAIRFYVESSPHERWRTNRCGSSCGGR